MRKITILAIVISIITSILSTGCNTKTENTVGNNPVTQKNPTKTTIAIDGDPGSLNSIILNSAYQLNLLSHINDPLIRVNASNKPIPAIAENWNISDNGLTYTFKLRNTNWSDGSALTSKDFIFVFKQILINEKNCTREGLLSCVKNAREYSQNKVTFDEVGIKSPDDKTLIIELNKPSDYLLNLLAMCFPIKQAFFETQGNNYGKDADKILYNGPWKLKEWKHNERLILEKNSAYWNANKIKIDTVIFRIISDSSTSFNAFLADEIDYATIDFVTVEKAKKEGITPISYFNGSVRFLDFNCNDPIIKNVNIRKALSLSIDKKLLVNNVYKGHNPAYNFISPIIFGEKSYLITEIGSSFSDINSTEALQLFKEGLKQLGNPKNIQIQLLCGSQLAAEFLSASWKKSLGIDVSYKLLEGNFDQFFNNIKKGTYQIALYTLMPNSNNALDLLSRYQSNSSTNYSRYSNSEYDALLKKIEFENDPKTRIQIIKQLDSMLANDASVCPISFATINYIIKPWLKGLNTNGFSNAYLDLYDAYIDESTKK